MTQRSPVTGAPLLCVERRSGMANKRTVVLTKEECYCDIVEFYNLVARKLGYDSDKVGYDCRRIDVTKPVQDQIFAFYREEQKALGESIAAAWVGYGPKASLPGEGYEAKIFDGFITARN